MGVPRIAHTLRMQLDELMPMAGERRYRELLRVAKIMEEAGEAMEALIAYHNVNPRKPQGPLQGLVDELCDVAITAQVALEELGINSDEAIRARGEALVARLQKVTHG